jgi:hypothetical protein
MPGHQLRQQTQAKTQGTRQIRRVQIFVWPQRRTTFHVLAHAPPLAMPFLQGSHTHSPFMQ